MSVDFKTKAIEFVTSAVQEDQAENYEKAYELYLKALEYFQAHLKYDKNPRSKEAITAKLMEYLKRAETIKQLLDIVDSTANSQAKATRATATKAKAKGHGDNEDSDLEKIRGSLGGVILEEKPNVKWDDVAGLEGAKEVLKEAVILPIQFPQFFTGARKPWSGILLYGPRGTGKSYLAKAIATEADSTFFAVSSSDLVSTWIGESEALMSQLFALARERAPSIVFIDEIDSLCSARGDSDESKAARRIKTEFLVQMQGIGKGDKRVLVLGATNMPHNLDQAVRRRFDKRIYIPLPEAPARSAMLKTHVKDTPHNLRKEDFDMLGAKLEGFSGSDCAALVKDVLFEPVRKTQDATHFKKVKMGDQELWEACSPGDPDAVQATLQSLVAEGKAHLVHTPLITIRDFDRACERARPTVSEADLGIHQKFTEKIRGSLGGVILEEKPNVKWDDVTGLEGAKEALKEAVIMPIQFPQFFTGARKPWSSILLYGPPGTGKSYLAKAIATEADSTFFAVSSSDLVSTWIRDSEELMSQLFALARERAPSIVFIDEIDSLCSARGDSGESEAARRIKTEFLVQMQGIGKGDKRVLVLGATNMPHNLDQAVRRRFDKRIYIPLPEAPARSAMLKIHLKDTPHNLRKEDFDMLGAKLEGFSGSDCAALVKDVLFEPVWKTQDATHFKKVKMGDQELLEACSPGDPDAFQAALQSLAAEGKAHLVHTPLITIRDVDGACERARPTVSEADLGIHQKFTDEFGEEI